MPRKPKAPPPPPAKAVPRNAAKFGPAETGPLTLRLPLDLIAEIRATAKQRVQTPSQYLAWLYQQQNDADQATARGKHG